ncbi:MAG: sugar phosphate isomerase/epimerase [Anaerolineaceae bacterium]|nr:sugar phosphate isomerase/epimerase [Anaerolineaceae bacterium]
MNISVVTSVFVNYRLMDAIDEIHKLGVEGVDIWCGRPHLYRKDYSKNILQELKEKLKQLNLSPVSLMPAFAHYPYSLSSPIEIVRKDSISYMKDCIDNAALIGAPYVLVVPKQSLYGQTRDDSRRFFMNSLSRVCNYAESRGIKLVVEVVYPKLSNYMGFIEDAINVIRQLGSSNIGVAIDTGHLNLSGEDVGRAIEELGDLLLQVHVNDNNKEQQQNTIPGEGNFDFARFMSLLKEYNYGGFLSIELSWAYSFDPVSALIKAIKRLRCYTETN